MSTIASLPVHTSSRSSALAHRSLRVFSASLAVAIAAHVSFPLPFTPIPFTLQPLAVLGVGLALGPVDGCAALLSYLAEGAVGLPVFSPTGLGGVLQLFGPTGGFLMAYPAVAYVAGAVTRRLEEGRNRFVAALTGCIAATLLLFLCGAVWLSHVLHLSAAAAWMQAVTPFLPGETVKAFAAAGIYRALKRPITPRL